MANSILRKFFIGYNAAFEQELREKKDSRKGVQLLSAGEKLREIVLLYMKNLGIGFAVQAFG